METSRTTLLQRPMGPRGPSSSKGRLPLLRTPNPLSPTQPEPPNVDVAERMGSLSLNPPQPQRAGGGRPKLQLGISNAVQFESYYGGPTGAPEQHLSPGEDEGRTIRPVMTIMSTATPAAPRNGASQQSTMNPLKDVLDGIAASRPSSQHQNPSDEEDAILQSPPPTQWSDSMLEEIERLGEGAGGAVHKVRDLRTGQLMARKTITTRAAPMKQLLRELQIMSSTKHVNIVAFYGAYMSPSSSEVKILMEFGEGGSLEAVAKRIRDRGAIVGEKIAGRIAEGVLQGLAYLHSKKTIHRDIKPSNILLSKEGIVKLCDFGVSGELVASNANTFTGTSFYMAPERICGKEYTIRSDVWSTGISLLELVQNRFPFPTDVPPIELMMHIMSSQPPTLEDEDGVQWSEEMKDFIKQTLIVDSLTRPTPRDMLAHPWIINMMKHENTMARWIGQVWEWSKSKKSRDDSTSRPSTRGTPDP